MNAVSFSAGALATIVADATVSRDRLDTLTQQAASGHVADTYGGIGRAGAGEVLSLRPALAQQSALQQGIDTAGTRMNVARTALQGITGIAQQFFSSTNQLDGNNPGQIDSIAASARAAMGQVADLLNSRAGDIYVFAGDDTANPPVPNPDQVAAGPFATAIASAVGQLAGSGAASTIAATLGAAAPSVKTLFSSAIEAGTAQVPQIAVGGGQHVRVGIVAGLNAEAVSSGPSTTGSYLRDLMRALATIGALSGSQANVAGFSALVQDTHGSLGSAITALGTDAGVLGDRQSALADTRSRLGDVSDALTTQISNVEDVDMTKTLSELSAAQSRLQASYRLISSLQNLSLAQYLG